MNEATPTSVAYVGMPGAGFGFRLAGMNIQEASSSEEAIRLIRRLKDAGEASIIFVDERLAVESPEAMAKLNEDSLPAIVLLPNPAQPHRIAAKNLNQLIVKAVGSDILKNAS